MCKEYLYPGISNEIMIGALLIKANLISEMWYTFCPLNYSGDHSDHMVNNLLSFIKPFGIDASFHKSCVKINHDCPDLLLKSRTGLSFSETIKCQHIGIIFTDQRCVYISVVDRSDLSNELRIYENVILHVWTSEFDQEGLDIYLEKINALINEYDLVAVYRIKTWKEME